MTAPADSSLSLPTVLDDATRRFLRFARDRDPTALEMVLRDSSDRAYAHARRLLGNAADAEDAVQEAFLQLVKTSGRYDGSITFAAWLARLVHVAAVRALRSRGRRTRRERLVSSTSSGSADPAASDVHDVVRDAVKELPETFRAAIDLHYFSGLSQEDAATALGVSANTLAVRIHRARERLRRTLRSRGFAATGAIIVGALA
nr:sigma-70 family RNA polymerase sigma factor [Planctomycetota bacterium]